MMKTLLSLLLILAIFSAKTYAQPKRENIHAYKVAYITKKLDLSPEEAQQFWPVYNKFNQEIESIRMAKRKSTLDIQDDVKLQNAAAIEKFVDGEIAFKQQELDVLKKYHSQFKSVLPIHKVAKLYRAEDEFKKELIEKIKAKRNNKP